MNEIPQLLLPAEQASASDSTEGMANTVLKDPFQTDCFDSITINIDSAKKAKLWGCSAVHANINFSCKESSGTLKIEAANLADALKQIALACEEINKKTR
jgi:hypothetical protein